MKEALAIAATLLAIGGNLPYLLDILKGRVKPHPYTWLVWTLVSGTVFFGMLTKGAGVGALPVAASEIFTLIIFIFSLKFGFKGVTATDAVFLTAALAGMIPWILTTDPTLSVAVAVGIDLIAFGPTLRKTWRHPDTESPILYGSNVLRHILGLLSLQTYNVATTLHSIAMICSNSAMVLILLLRKNNRRMMGSWRG